ncbi:AraC family transcriptional regulator [Paenirhodobacter enshiensis]|uniref:AraC family transcriptional regulator n=1 Tax=Paenirhodobacter enshiensis TaxID=1105367 RepID=UPI0035B22DF9
MERRVISPGFVEDALACLKGSSTDAASVLAAAGMPDTIAEPVSNSDYGRLWWLVAAAIQDEFFGLAKRPMRPGSFEMLCHAILHTDTLDHALRRALQFLNIVLDDPRGELRIRDGQAEIMLIDADRPRGAFAHRTYWVILMGVVCWLIGRRLPLRRLDFCCAAPLHRDDYRQFFGAPVFFEQPESRLVFNSAHLALPVIRDEQALKIFLRDAPGNILVGYRHEQGMTAKIRQKLDGMSPVDWPQFHELAAGLQVTPITLRRRLKAEGQTYSTIKGELRGRLARRLLDAGEHSVAEIAGQLGYSEPSAFYRAFQKWSGNSPRGTRPL